MNDHDDLRQLFADATSDVRPQGSLDDILDRTKKVDPMTRRWFLPVVAAAAVIGLAIGGAVWLSRDSSPSSSTPPPAGSPSGNPSSGTSTVVAVPVYYLGATAHGTRLYREFHRQPVDECANCLLLASADAAVSGTPDDPDYTNSWPAGTKINSATYDGNVLTIDLHQSDGPVELVDRGAELAIQQLIYSAQAGLGKGRVPVQLLVDGEHVPTILGVPTAEPLAADDELDVLAPVQISSPGNGMKVPAGELKVTGVAAAFEANVVWELMVGGDTVVKNGHATAAECCTLAPYEFTITGLEPGTYTLVVHDEDMSGEGRPVNQDTKEFTVG